MKKLFTLSLVLLTLLLVSCSSNKQNHYTEKGDFKFCSLEWGINWETVQKSDIFQNADIINENGNRKTVKLENAEYLEVPISDIGLVFDSNGIGDTAGLVTVFVQYAEDDEKTLLTNLEELYGERKNTPGTCYATLDATPGYAMRETYSTHTYYFTYNSQTHSGLVV